MKAISIGFNLQKDNVEQCESPQNEKLIILGSPKLVLFLENQVSNS